MYTFNVKKFKEQKAAKTKDGELKVIRMFELSNGLFHVALKYVNQSAGIIQRTYDQQGRWVNLYGERTTQNISNDLVNE